MSPKVVVIGGGPAGLMAAGRAAELGADVLLIEKTRRVGNKLRLTGNGRCNLTHEGDIHGFLTYVPRNGPFLVNSLSRFFSGDLRTRLSSLGVPTVAEPDGRVFPTSNRADDVVEALLRFTQARGVRLHCGSPVAEILTEGNGVRGVVLEDRSSLEAEAVVLATGGSSYPHTGSTGDGYRLAGRLGHTVIPPRAGLVPLVTNDDLAAQLQGLSLRGAGVTLYQGELRIATGVGEVLFTHFGLSGPLILNLSLRASEALAFGPLRLCIDLAPSWTEAQLDEHLLQAVARSGRSGYHVLLRGLVPQALADVLVERGGFPRGQRASQLTSSQRERMRRLVKSLEVTVTGTRPIAEATITLGGIDVKEIYPRTMASRLVRGLYFAGEVLDVAAETGGYNLQIAFTTGHVAGESAALASLNPPSGGKVARW
jgi:hypothetical protein